MQACATSSPMDMAFSTLVRRFAALFFTETGVWSKIRIFPTGVVFKKWVILVRRNTEFYKDLGWEYEYQTLYHAQWSAELIS